MTIAKFKLMRLHLVEDGQRAHVEFRPVDETTQIEGPFRLSLPFEQTLIDAFMSGSTFTLEIEEDGPRQLELPWWSAVKGCQGA